MSTAAQAYSRTSYTTGAPRDIEAQALLKAAQHLQDVQTNWQGPDKNMHKALLFNRRLWSIFMSAGQAHLEPRSLIRATIQPQYQGFGQVLIESEPVSWIFYFLTRFLHANR